MSEIFDSAAQSTTLPLPSDETLALSADEIPWCDSGTEGFWIKSLFEDENTSQKTWLMKVDPGAYAPAHAHTEFEQIYVLSGTFYDQDRTYRAGDYAIRPPHYSHEAGSKDGALVLLVYSNV